MSLYTFVYQQVSENRWDSDALYLSSFGHRVSGARALQLLVSVQAGERVSSWSQASDICLIDVFNYVSLHLHFFQ